MALDYYITLGRSGLRVSPFCLGAMTFGEDLGWGSSVDESKQIIDRYVALGGNFIDTANFYTRSHSEKIIDSTWLYSIRAVLFRSRKYWPRSRHRSVSSRPS